MTLWAGHARGGCERAYKPLKCSFLPASSRCHVLTAYVSPQKYIMPACAIITCRKRSQVCTKAGDGISFHRFPTDPGVRKLWIEATGRINWIPTKSSTICSQHFDDDNYQVTKSGKRNLKLGAYPHKYIARCYSTSRHDRRVSSPEEHFNIQDSSSDSLIDDPSEDNHEASADKIRCPKCSTEIEMKQYVQDRVNAILVNVYRYFATEGTKLSPSQLRERTALCTGASEADVECALVLHQEVSATQKPLRKPPRKRRKKESKSPPPIQEEEPYIERETLIVAVDPKAGDANSEINPLAIKEEQPSSPITCEQDASLCEPLQSGLKPEDMAKVFVKTEPSEEPNIGPTQSSRPEQSSGGGPTPDIPPDTYFMIKNEEIDIEDNCGSGAESEEGYS